MYDYLEAVKEDVKNYIDENVALADYNDKDELSQYLEDNLWAENSVTGNAAGSYTFSRYEAEENLCHNWDILEEIADDWGSDTLDFFNPEALDVMIRCYFLNDAISEVLDEMEDNGELPKEWGGLQKMLDNRTIQFLEVALKKNKKLQIEYNKKTNEIKILELKPHIIRSQEVKEK